MEDDHRVGDLVRELVCHLQKDSSSPNPNPNSKDVKYAIRILSSRMTPLILANEDSIANSIKSQMAKQGKLSDALSFTDLYSKFASKTGPGSVKNKRSVLYLLKVISEDRNSNPKFQLNQTIGDSEISNNSNKLHNYSSSKLKSGGILSISRPVDDIRNTAYMQFSMLLNEESNISEEVLVSDVLSVCQGIDGNYVKFDENIDGYTLTDSIKVPKATKIIIRKLCELGWLFRKVNQFICEVINNFPSENVGLVAKSFCIALKDELLEYHKLLTVLQSQSMNPIPIVSETVSPNSKGYLTLRRLSIWLIEPMVRMRRMAVLVDSCQHLKGGSFAGAIHLHAQHGDPLLHDFMNRLLHKVSSPLFEMVRNWVLEGDLQDLYSEFFVSEHIVKPENLWQDGYQINELMLPSFISKSLANRILRTGKSINFLKVCCEDNSWVDIASEAVSITGTTTRRGGLGYGETNALESLVTEASKRIDKHLINIIFNRYKFKKHCLAIKRYILLGQGDFVQYLMEIIGPELSEPAKTISLIHLSGLLQKAIVSSTAQYDDRAIIDRLTVKMMPHGTKDKGWDVFCLNYHVGVPLNTVFKESVMSNYLRIFNFLWKIKRVEHSVVGVWKTMKPNLITSNSFNKLPKSVTFRVVLISRRCQVLWDEMNHFVKNLQSYMMFEVLEVSWAKFCVEIEAAEDVDDLIGAHHKYLNTIIEKSLVGERCEDIYKILLMLFDVILRFCNVADRLFEGIFEFRSSNKSKEGKKGKSKRTESDEWVNDGRKAVTKRAEEFLKNMGQDLDGVSKEYSSISKKFISELHMQQHIDLKFLMFRLHFTEFGSLNSEVGSQ